MNTELQISKAATCSSPPQSKLQHWTARTLEHVQYTPDAQISLRIVTPVEMREINLRYRGHDKPTNVLAFPALLPEAVAHPLLGDIIICEAIVEREARDQHKSSSAHWAHMIVHATLHLLGYDHQEEEEALAMEALETEILGQLSFPPPYAEYHQR